MKQLSKYSFGLGDRFGMQGKAQLQALSLAKKKGLNFDAVWNKSYREHQITGTSPESVREEADEAVGSLNWKDPYFVDADHIHLGTVEDFIGSSDFFTIDVASYIGKKASDKALSDFYGKAKRYFGEFEKLDFPVEVKDLDRFLEQIGMRYVYAVEKAGEIYRLIEQKKGEGNFVAEVSMDEVKDPQTPLEIFFILMLLSDAQVPLQSFAPKFSGRFNKGVDYEGDLGHFEKEFEQDLLVLRQAVSLFGLSENLKLSIHSGSDKFSIYPIMGRLLKKYDLGIHIKTAGTTWLEELTGLAEAGGQALDFVKALYAESLERIDELTKPYADVLDISVKALPAAEELGSWDAQKLVHTIEHNPGHKDYNKDVRQLLHVGYKIAAEQRELFDQLRKENIFMLERRVTENIYQKHILRLFS